MEKLKLFIDGSSYGNPGLAGVGVVVVDEKNNLILQDAQPIGIRTNNQAEYEALILGLKHVLKLKPQHVDIFSDSELLVSQVKGEAKVRSKPLIPLYETSINLLKQLESYNIHSIPRELNTLADKLAKSVIHATRRRGD